ncbi:MAG: hypothetical protein H6721_25080 [Sandaracinus sp.]|nr:hypothetical protein [Sandaracinus sp.]MCB9623295.1 hypothetical protein [Sandaracinus sp.]MCB9635407.1 hypothetical protein [Sandaracinus sp.]
MRSMPLLVLALACGGEPAPSASPAALTEPSPAATRDGASPPPATWVRSRVEESVARMESSEAGRLVAQSIEAHGGLEAWLSKGTIAFDFDYHPITQPERRMRSYQQVDLWSARARHEERGVTAETPTGGPTDTEGAVNAPLATFGWDGTEAWIAPDASAFPSTARFWSLTPYFFVGMPFVAADPGTRYERLPDAALDGVSYQLVKLTYEAGTGDAPDDYYVLYLHPETHRLAALRYVVSYPGFFTPGNHSPEKIMRYTAPSTVDGLTFATRLDTYAWSDEGQGEKVTNVVVGDLTLGESWPDTLFARPNEAVAAELVPRAE